MSPGQKRTAEDTAAEILRSLRRLTHAADVQSSRLRHTQKITGPQAACLQILHGNGPMTLTRLATETDVGPSTVNGIVDRLESKGLALRHRDTRDRRRVFVQLTDAGSALVQALPQPIFATLVQALCELPVEERDRLADAFSAVAEILQPPPRMHRPQTTVQEQTL